MPSLDEMIMDVEAERTSNGRVRLKFLAISGGCGPEFSLDETLAQAVVEKLTAALRQ